MEWNAEYADKLLRKKKGINFISPVNKKTNRYKLQDMERILHLAIPKERADGRVSAYINQHAISGESYKEGVVSGVSVAKLYPKGHKGEKGRLGISRSVAGLPTLNPENNDVVLLHIDSPTAFEKLISWYLGEISLTSPTPKRGVMPIENPKVGLDGYVDSDAKPQGSTKYQDDPKKRECIEKYAVERAIKHYENLKFSIEERGKPFDLLCIKDSLVLHVEVKGTTGSGETVTLTKNEVNDARDGGWQSDLFIAYQIDLIQVDGEWVASGGEIKHLEKWAPDDRDLTATEYEYRVPKL